MLEDTIDPIDEDIPSLSELPDEVAEQEILDTESQDGVNTDIEEGDN